MGLGQSAQLERRELGGEIHGDIGRYGEGAQLERRELGGVARQGRTEEHLHLIRARARLKARLWDRVGARVRVRVRVRIRGCGQG